MTKLAVLLAQLDAFNPLGPMPPVSKSTSLAFKNLMFIGAVVLVLTLLLILWARRYARRSKRRRRHESQGESATAAPAHTGSRRHHRHRHRRRRRQQSSPERGKNPTVAETGGLPPVRPQARPNPPA